MILLIQFNVFIFLASPLLLILYEAKSRIGIQKHGAAMAIRIFVSVYSFIIMDASLDWNTSETVRNMFQ